MIYLILFIKNAIFIFLIFTFSKSNKIYSPKILFNESNLIFKSSKVFYIIQIQNIYELEEKKLFEKYSNLLYLKNHFYISLYAINEKSFEYKIESLLEILNDLMFNSQKLNHLILIYIKFKLNN